MFYEAKWTAMIQAALPFYQPLLPPHRLSREAELISELFAASALVDKCTNIVNQMSLWCVGKQRGETKPMFTKQRQNKHRFKVIPHIGTIYVTFCKGI